MDKKLFILFFIFIGFLTFQLNGQESYPYPVPKPQQLAWQEAELGVVFHYDLHVFDEKKYTQSKKE